MKEGEIKIVSECTVVQITFRLTLDKTLCHSPTIMAHFPFSCAPASNGFQTASMPANDSANALEKPLAISLICALPESTNLPPGKRRKPTPSFAKIKVPRTSTFKVFSDEEIQRAGAPDDNFVATFEKKCLVGVPVLQKFEGSFPVDIWKDILDHARSTNLWPMLSRRKFVS